MEIVTNRSDIEAKSFGVGVFQTHSPAMDDCRHRIAVTTKRRYFFLRAQTDQFGDIKRQKLEL